MNRLPTFAVCCVVLSVSVSAQEPLRPHRLLVPPAIDGRVSGAEWHGVEPLPLVNLYPSFQSPLTERTEIRVAYDDRYFYASNRAWDSEPDRVRASTLYRDRWESDDEFAVILDTFADGQNAAMFLVTPAGVRVDNQLTHDAEPGRGEWMNRDWNVPWDAAAARLPDGWSAEMRVPFSSVRFQSVNGRVTMRLKTYRYLPRKGENQMFPATRPDAGAQPHFKPSLGRVVVFDDVQAAVPVYLQPYLSGTTAARGSDARDLNAGLDVKLSPTRSTTLDLTVNTDFAQVEVDQLQVNLTRFPLRFPERRPFFLERAGLFAVGLGSDETLFNSRTVGLSAEGVPTPILGGARFAGRVTGWDVGLLNVQTSGDTAANASVVRVQRAGAGGGTFGVTATSQVAGRQADVAGAVDGSVRFGQHLMSGVWAASSGGGALRERARGMVRWQRGAELGLSFTGEYRFTGRAFAPALGFVRITDSHETDVTVRQSWRPAQSPLIRRHGLAADVSARWRRGLGDAAIDAALEDARASLGWSAEITNGVFGSATIEVSEEDVPAGFAITPVTFIPPGRYQATAGRVFLATPPARALQVFATGEAGGFFGGRRVGWRVEPVWTPSPHFQGWVIYDGTRLSGLPAGADAIDLFIAGARAALNTHVFFDLIAQRAGRTPAIAQARFRWNASEGHDLWVVFERGGAGARGRSHSLSVKYTRLLSIGA